jgi:hypothetical protein
LAAGGQHVYLCGEVKVVEERGEAMTAGQAQVSGQAQGVEDGGGADCGTGTAKQSPVDVYVVADEDTAVDEVCEVRRDVSDSRCLADVGVSQSGRYPGPRWDGSARVDQGAVRLVCSRFAGGDGHDRDFEDGFVVAVLGAAAFKVERDEIVVAP